MTTGLYSARNSSCDKLYHTAVKCYLDTWSLCVINVESSTAQGYWTLKIIPALATDYNTNGWFF